MELTRGTTPTITAKIKNAVIPMNQIQEVWLYISQMNKVKVSKEYEDVTLDSETNSISVTLTQDDTLGLRAGNALFQIRLLMNDSSALATPAIKVKVNEVYRGGEIVR